MRSAIKSITISQTWTYVQDVQCYYWLVLVTTKRGRVYYTVYANCGIPLESDVRRDWVYGQAKNWQKYIGTRELVG